MHCLKMLTYEQIQAIENALGADAAKPVVEAIQSTDQRVLSSLLAEIATKADLEKLRGEMREENASMRGDVKRLDLQLKLLIALAVLAIAMFSPNFAALVRLAK